MFSACGKPSVIVALLRSVLLVPVHADDDGDFVSCVICAELILLLLGLMDLSGSIFMMYVSVVLRWKMGLSIMTPSDQTVGVLMFPDRVPP